MTREQWSKMTDEEKRSKVAELCGFIVDHKRPDTIWKTYETPGKLMPDYLNDLNAMHEAEKLMTIGQWMDYLVHLGAVAEPKIMEDWKVIAHATAVQRAEAFVLTKADIKGGD